MKAKYRTCPGCQCVSVQFEDIASEGWSSFFGPDTLQNLRNQGYELESHGNRACPQCATGGQKCPTTSFIPAQSDVAAAADSC